MAYARLTSWIINDNFSVQCKNIRVLTDSDVTGPTEEFYNFYNHCTQCDVDSESRHCSYKTSKFYTRTLAELEFNWYNFFFFFLRHCIACRGLSDMLLQCIRIWYSMLLLLRLQLVLVRITCIVNVPQCFYFVEVSPENLKPNGDLCFRHERQWQVLKMTQISISILFGFGILGFIIIYCTICKRYVLSINCLSHKSPVIIRQMWLR